MKLISAVIRTHALDALKDALFEQGIFGMTVSEVRGVGRQRGHTETYRGVSYAIDFLPKLKVEIVVAESDVNTLVQTLREAVCTGEIGDGKIFITPLEGVIRIRTGEMNESAL